MICLVDTSDWNPWNIETILPHTRRSCRCAWHDRDICTRIANNTTCAVGLLVFLPQFASLAGVVAPIFFGQVYPWVSRQGWTYPAQAHIYSSTDGYDGGYLYYLLYKNATHPNHRLGSGCNRLYRCRLYCAESQLLILNSSAEGAFSKLILRVSPIPR